MAINLSTIALLLLTVAFLGFISIDEAEARALLPAGSVERGSSVIQEYSRPASILVPSPSSPYGPSPFKSSSLTTDDDDIDHGTTTVISKTTTSAAASQQTTPQILNKDSRSRNSRPAKSPPPPPYSPYGPSPCRGSVGTSHSSIKEIPANSVTSPVLVDTI